MAEESNDVKNDKEKYETVLQDFEAYGFGMHEELVKTEKEKERFKAMYERADKACSTEKENRKKAESEVTKLRTDLDAALKKLAEIPSPDAQLIAKIASLEDENRNYCTELIALRDQNSSSVVCSDVICEKDEEIKQKDSIIREMDVKLRETRRKHLEIDKSRHEEIESLQNENDDLRQKNEALKKLSTEKNPEAIKQLVDVEQIKKEAEQAKKECQMWKTKFEENFGSNEVCVNLQTELNKLRKELSSERENNQNFEKELKTKIDAENLYKRNVEEMERKNKQLIDENVCLKNRDKSYKQLVQESNANESLKNLADVKRELERVKNEFEIYKKNSESKKVNSDAEVQLRIERDSKSNLLKERDELRELLCEKLSMDEFIKKVPKVVAPNSENVRKLLKEIKALEEKIDSMEKSSKVWMESFQEQLRLALAPMET